MHIVFVSHEYSHPSLPNAGGIGRFLTEFSQLLVQNGHQVTVMGYSDNHLDTEYMGVRLLFKKTGMTPLHVFLERVFHKLGWTKSLIPFHAKDRFRLGQRVDRYCEENKVDIIEVNDYLGDGAYIKSDIPIVLRSHGSYKLLEQDLGFRKNESFVYFEEEQMKIVNEFISVSQFSADKLKALFNINKEINIVYNGVETESLYRKPFPKNSRVFYFGTFSEAKGSDRLIEIYNKLSDEFPEMEFAIAGKTKEYYESNIYPHFTENLKSKVKFLGFLNPDGVSKEINKSTYIVFPSRLENFSVALLEAMSRGRICFGWDIPSFNEVLINGENGFIVNSPDDVINEVRILESDSLKRFEISEESTDYIHQNFSKEQMVDKSVSIYRELVTNYEKKTVDL